MTPSTQDDSQSSYLLFFILGGLSVGTGILSLYWSFGFNGADLNGDFGHIGFSALDNIALLPVADFSIPLVVMGAMMLIFANSTAWKDTGGY